MPNKHYIENSSLESFLEQKEFLTTADVQDIYFCFRLILGRNPNLEECAGHSSMVGVNLTQVVKSYVQSLEFQNRSLLNTQMSNVAIHSIENFQMYVDLDDQAVGVHIAGGNYEPHVTKIFKKYLKSGMSVLDIGANIGYFSMLAASLVGTTGRVVAMEPNMENCKLHQASKNLNEFSQISIMQVAAGKSTGLLSLNSSYSNGTTSTVSSNIDLLMKSKTVPAVKIDDQKIFDSGLDFIKIDVEGAEYNALVGAEQLIRKFKPVIVSEFSPNLMPGISGVSGEVYLNYLISLGYDISVISLDGSVVNHKSNVTKVLAAFQDAGVDHIDILAIPSRKSWRFFGN